MIYVTIICYIKINGYGSSEKMYICILIGFKKQHLLGFVVYGSQFM